MGRGAGHEEEELLTALKGVRARKSARQIAIDIHGEDEVAASWYSDSARRAQIRRLVRKVRALINGGYRDLAAGRRPSG